MTRWTSPWALLFALVGASILSLGAALFAVDRIGESIIDSQAQAAAQAEQSYWITLAREEGLAALIDTFNRRERIHGGSGFRYALTDAHGNPIAGVPSLKEALGTGRGWKVAVTQVGGKRKTWHVLVGTLPTGQSLYIAQDSEQRTAFRQALIEVSVIALAFVTLASTLGGVWLSSYLLRRTGHIGDTAEAIAAGNLNARVVTYGHGDVFDRLGDALNAMLARIEELMTGMRTITDSLAHDLRRPLAQVQRALERAENANERDDALAEARAATQDALATFSALIDVARAETGLSAESMSDVDVGALLLDTAELFEPMFEDAGQTFKFDLANRPTMIRGHALLLRQAVGNLLHNASTYAGKGAIVTLTERQAANQVDIVVADTGPGIPEADRGRVRERFVRLDPARTTEGSGLGLAIAAACAKLHGGALLLEDNHPGLRAVLRLSRR